MTRRQLIWSRILFAVYLAAVAFLCFGRFSNSQDVPTDLWGIPTDKLVHFAMFFPFPILAFLAFDTFTQTVRETLLFVGVTLLVGILIAVGTEMGQANLTDYRSGDPLDLVADTIGLSVSSLITAVWDIRKQKK